MTHKFPLLDYIAGAPGPRDWNCRRGAIVNYAHLPADKKAGFKVVGITDQNYEQAQRTAKEHSLAQVFASVDDLLRQPEIEIVDIASYPAGTGDSSTDTPSADSAG
jgi:Oxidoreductase family, NAD-binding Rossmann fold